MMKTLIIQAGPEEQLCRIIRLADYWLQQLHSITA